MVPKAKEDLLILETTVSTTLDLINKLQSSAKPANNPSDHSVSPLHLAHDAASLVRAHVTKLSLLIINKPFTASAVTKILRELIIGPLPGLASSIELCGERYTKSLSSELQYWVGAVFLALKDLVEAIPTDGNELGNAAKNGTGAGKGSLAVTGTVWKACDGVIELKKLGIAGLVIKQAEEYRALLQDALEELQEWGEEESDGEAEDEYDSEDEQAVVDNMFSQKHIPVDDPDKLRPKLASALKRLRSVVLLYKATVKRRLKTLPRDVPLDEGTTIRLDEIMDSLKKIPGITDDLANAFYELDGSGIDEQMVLCFSAASGAAELLLKDWKDQDDEFSTWASKFRLAMTGDPIN